MDSDVVWLVSIQADLFAALKFARAFIFLFACHCAVAQTGLLNYKGRISVDGAPFNGTGLFAFSIQETNGKVLWTSGDFPIEGSSKSPPRIQKLSVTQGVYNVRLGDSMLGMPALDLDTLRRAAS